jgi:hypothetical protein
MRMVAAASASAMSNSEALISPPPLDEIGPW